MQMLLFLPAVRLIFSNFSHITAPTRILNIYLQFAVSLSVVLLLELAAAVAAYALQDSVRSLLAENINATMYQYGSNEEAKLAINFMQSKVRQPA